VLLMIFDIDGTLVRGNGIDDVCFVEAVKEVLGIQLKDTDWFQYSMVTDSGITSEIIEKRLFRKARDSDIAAVREAYLRNLRLEIERDPACFQPTPGASELVTQLRLMENICICIATGGWRDSALLKLETAGIDTQNIPLVSSDDAYRREVILSMALERALIHKKCVEFDRIVYIADHAEDFENSKKLGYDFIGIGKGDRGLELRRRGVTNVQPDFVDVDYFLSITARTSSITAG
jgi:beta-phosphoglucomutase-like phosphatase (HAD superfamily)